MVQRKVTEEYSLNKAKNQTTVCVIRQKLTDNQVPKFRSRNVPLQSLKMFYKILQKKTIATQKFFLVLWYGG